MVPVGEVRKRRHGRLFTPLTSLCVLTLLCAVPGCGAVPVLLGLEKGDRTAQVALSVPGVWEAPIPRVLLTRAGPTTECQNINRKTSLPKHHLLRLVGDTDFC